MTIQLNFESPNYVSSEITELDLLTIAVKEPELF